MSSTNTIGSYTGSKAIPVYTTDHKFVGSGKLSIEGETSSIKVKKTVQEEGQYPSSIQTKIYTAQGKFLKKKLISYTLYELIVNLEETSIDPLRPKEVMIQSQEISSILDERKLALSPSNKVIYPDHQL